MERTDRHWIQKTDHPEKVDELRRSLDIPGPIARVLVNRGIYDISDAKRFLEPTLRDLHPPQGLADMDRAVERVLSALDSGERIVVYGDYDVDGVTSVALLKNFFDGIGTETIPVIPHRELHGYGMHMPLLKRHCVRGEPALIITVDCGISDAEVIAGAKEAGWDVIVTDHHEPPETLPPACAVINPKRSGNAYPFASLAGVGVAFLLVWALAKALKERGFWPEGSEPSLKEHLDLVALGTVADQAPLLGENRTFVKHGLQCIASSPRPGIAALLAVCGFNGKSLSTGVINFQLAPRLNAPGRVDEALPSLELLLSDDPTRTAELARLLDDMNKTRQRIEEVMVEQAFALAEEEVQKGRKALVLADERWRPGVVGIVASRLVDRFGLPTILIAIHEGAGKGSGRSPEGFHLLDAIIACRDRLLGFGGHSQAAGVRIDPKNLDAFREDFCARAKSLLGDRPIGRSLTLDDRLNPDQVDDALVEHLENLAPHGIGNPEPVFRLGDMEVKESRLVGKDHLKLWVRKEGFTFESIGFGMGDLLTDRLHQGVHIACLPQFNEWQGRRRIQLKLKDLKHITDENGADENGADGE